MSTTSSEAKNNKLISLDSNVFRNVIGHFTSGVSIITVRENQIDYGITASAVCSVTDDPPMLLVCANKRTGTSQAIAKANSFTVNILEKGQNTLALQFAKANTNKFEDVDFSYGELGNPVLNDALAQLECEVVEEITGGTHSVFLAKVKGAYAFEGDPLVYYRGKFGQFNYD